MSIYLDNAATTKPSDSVVDAVIPYLKTKWYNPSSLYGKGKNVKYDIENAKKVIANFINADAEEIFFTSGSTESNNWVIRGWDDDNFKNDSVIITTPIEHSSIIYAVNNPVLHSKIYFCDVNSYGLVDIDSLKRILEGNKNKRILVSIIMANNEIGTIQDAKTIGELVHKYNGVFHMDSTQAFGHIPIDVKEMGIDMLSASGQKLGGLKGTGILYKNKNVSIAPLIYGSQQWGLRGGTENVAGIIGLAKAVELCNVKAGDIIAKCNVRDYIIEILVNNFGCKLNGHEEQRLPNNINVTFPNISGESLLYMLDMSDILVSTASACNSRSVEPSYVLKAIGLSDEEAMSTIRITLPDIFEYKITEYVEIIEKFLNELSKAIKIINA